jgi:hypothetical protein
LRCPVPGKQNAPNLAIALFNSLISSASRTAAVAGVQIPFWRLIPILGEAVCNDIAITVRSSQQLTPIQSSRYRLCAVLSARKILSVAIICARVNSSVSPGRTKQALTETGTASRGGPEKRGTHGAGNPGWLWIQPRRINGEGCPQASEPHFAHIPTIRQWKLASLPKHLSVDEVDRTLATCEKSPVGKRVRSNLRSPALRVSSEV